ncbi:RRQRL motif-containing zinc-binding protein [Nocardia gipuzkoensis]
MIGPKDARPRDLPDPTGERFGIPTYYWGTAPKELGATRRQLLKDGLRPKNRKEIDGQVIRPRSGGREPLAAYLYRVEDATPKPQPTPAQLAAAAKALRARQERAMQRHGVSVPEVERDGTPELDGDPGPQWEWDGFDR